MLFDVFEKLKVNSTNDLPCTKSLYSKEFRDRDLYVSERRFSYLANQFCHQMTLAVMSQGCNILVHSRGTSNG